MPIYTYRCEHCGVQFDRKQKFSDDPLNCCPECGHEALRKVYQPVGIVFKGSGFYSTDNRSPSGVNRNLKKSDSDDSQSSNDKTESTENTSSKEKTAGKKNGAELIRSESKE